MKYLTRQTLKPRFGPDPLEDYRNGYDPKASHDSSPNGCAEDCAACAKEEEFNPEIAWKLDVGAECNATLALADHLDSAPLSEKDSPVFVPATAAALRALVARVAAFEELETEAE